MTEDEFWAIVERSRGGGVGLDPDMLNQLSVVVHGLSDQELLAFDGHFRAARDRAYSWDLWAAGYLIQGGMSDDGFEDFRSWLIAHGRDIYVRALAEPDSMVDLTWRPDLEDMGLAEFYASVAVEEMGRRGLSAPYDPGPQDPSGAPFPEDDDEWFSQRFPRLWARLSG
ncbi:DUF4240 domain-containing protein [Nakamurella sp.]|uniref:DUF4240 domain-containing protein n=1 Tax=Nakamurella sp. TaxID=1869182 RepID=UPI003B3B7512